MNFTPIYRQRNINQEPGTAATVADSITYSYPFGQVNPIESHVHTKFIIAKFGQARTLTFG